MADGGIRVVLLGHFPVTIRAACLRSSADACLIPAFVLRTGRGMAMVVGADNRTLFLRWRSSTASDLAWTYDPKMFSPTFKKRSKARMSDLLADPATPRFVIRLGGKKRGKTAPQVS